MAAPLAPLWQRLLKAGCQSGTIMAFGDFTVQKVIEQKKMEEYDYVRTGRWALTGLTLHGPFFFLSFGQIDKYWGAATSLRIVMAKTATAQFTAFPVYLTLLFGWMGVLEGKGTTETMEKVQKRVPEAFMGGCVFWPIANTINFSVVSPAMRVPYLAGCGAIWNTFLSWLNTREEMMKASAVVIDPAKAKTSAE